MVQTVGLKNQNLSDWNCKICQVEKSKSIGLELQNLSGWDIMITQGFDKKETAYE